MADNDVTERARELHAYLKSGCVENPCAACERELVTITESLHAEYERGSEAARAEVWESPAMNGVRIAGRKLSNMAFNWKQRRNYPLSERDCRMLDEMWREWDASVELLHESLRQPQPTPDPGTEEGDYPLANPDPNDRGHDPCDGAV